VQAMPYYMGPPILVFMATIMATSGATANHHMLRMAYIYGMVVPEVVTMARTTGPVTARGMLEEARERGLLDAGGLGVEAHRVAPAGRMYYVHTGAGRLLDGVCAPNPDAAVEYVAARRQLPDGIYLAYDGPGCEGLGFAVQLRGGRVV